MGDYCVIVVITITIIYYHYGSYPLIDKQFAIENGDIYSGITH